MAVFQGSYNVGDTADLYVQFTDGGVPTDPDGGVALRVVAPDSSELNYTDPDFGNPEVGVYSYTLDLDQDGLWHYRWTAAGSVVAVEEGQLYVDRTPV